MDVNSRSKLIAYSKEKTWTNGLCFYLWVISYLRSHRVTSEIVFTVDNGEEFYIPRTFKIKSENDLIQEGFNYIYYYNCVREHSSIFDKTPYQYLKEQLSEIDEDIKIYSTNNVR